MGKAIRAALDNSVSKAITYRALATAEVFVVSWLITGNALEAAPVAGATAITSTVVYMAHDWLHCRFISRHH